MVNPVKVTDTNKKRSVEEEMSLLPREQANRNAHVAGPTFSLNLFYIPQFHALFAGAGWVRVQILKAVAHSQNPLKDKQVKSKAVLVVNSLDNKTAREEKENFCGEELDLSQNSAAAASWYMCAVVMFFSIFMATGTNVGTLLLYEQKCEGSIWQNQWTQHTFFWSLIKAYKHCGVEHYCRVSVHADIKYTFTHKERLECTEDPAPHNGSNGCKLTLCIVICNTELIQP